MQHMLFLLECATVFRSSRLIFILLKHELLHLFDRLLRLSWRPVLFEVVCNYTRHVASLLQLRLVIVNVGRLQFPHLLDFIEIYHETLLLRVEVLDALPTEYAQVV